MPVTREGHDVDNHSDDNDYQNQKQMIEAKLKELISMMRAVFCDTHGRRENDDEDGKNSEQDEQDEDLDPWPANSKRSRMRGASRSPNKLRGSDSD
ncbi:hypothetical protein JR316_0010145 [Psilocybe cubensis]|uniref:Uncharacterized protein n=1 Tax=Psilocybe cubensis TaxID=181762 RepID=A0ACB8GQV1_PSICU|nr:hypothetical protein JR316_0010145 [Psilocybe cubensis]KAH9477913.1 hypothetical protein JR316_0010145 [Psilocybe cubensis]